MIIRRNKPKQIRVENDGVFTHVSRTNSYILKVDPAELTAQGSYDGLFAPFVGRKFIIDGHSPPITRSVSAWPSIARTIGSVTPTRETI